MDMIILGIETSCDETGVAVVEQQEQSIQILSNVVASSMQLHDKTGGIIPEVAAREQVKFIIPVLDQALKEAEIQPWSIGAIAVTIGPGLIGSLLVGVETARTISYVWDKPLIPVNHLFGHIYANFISPPLRKEIASSQAPRNDKIEFPAISLIVSGGHTDLVFMKNAHTIQWIAGTRDDAAGEAFDKIGRLLELPYPAGPIIEQLAQRGDPSRFTFPRPLLHEPFSSKGRPSSGLDFSFSGLKTAVLREVQRLSLVISRSEATRNLPENDMNEISHFVRNDKNIDNQIIADLARATQDAIIDVLVAKTMKAVRQYSAKSILLCGGVAANQTLRDQFGVQCSMLNVKLFAPTKRLCTDNGAMIAAAAFFSKEKTDWRTIAANPELYFD